MELKVKGRVYKLLRNKIQLIEKDAQVEEKNSIKNTENSPWEISSSKKLKGSGNEEEKRVDMSSMNEVEMIELVKLDCARK